jgi:hypothetical protein
LASDVSEPLRRFVAERAGYRCEYCLLHESDSYSPHQIDHIISRKHDGLSDSDNLAYACLRCNAWKGSDIGSLDPQTGLFVKLFHPRRQRWDDHFVLRGAVIEPLTVEGRATARLLKLNLDKRIVERQLLAAVGRYPR